MIISLFYFSSKITSKLQINSLTLLRLSRQMAMFVRGGGVLRPNLRISYNKPLCRTAFADSKYDIILHI